MFAFVEIVNKLTRVLRVMLVLCFRRKMLLQVVCALALAGLTLADEPRRCCFDKEFSAVLGYLGGTVTNGVASAIRGSSYMAYDYYRHRQGTILTYVLPDNKTTTVWTVQDYNLGKMFTRVDNGSCTATPTPPGSVLFGPCLPDDAVYTGNATFGYGNDTLLVNGWEFRDRTQNLPEAPKNIIEFTEECTPFAQSMWGNIGGGPLQLTLFYTEYHPGIVDLSQLVIPDDCLHTDNGNNGAPGQ